jgi:hypothetical protein
MKIVVAESVQVCTVDTVNKWIIYTNQRLYLAQRQWLLGESVSELADKTACHQAMILLMQQAYVGILNELAETRRLKEKVDNLEALAVLSGFDSEWIVRLRSLAATPGEWLFELGRAYDALQLPQSGTGLRDDLSAATGLIASSVPETDWAFVLTQLKAFAAQLREFNYQY